jgi:hypothetical protein
MSSDTTAFSAGFHRSMRARCPSRASTADSHDGDSACQIFRRQRGHLTLMCEVHGHIVATQTVSSSSPRSLQTPCCVFGDRISKLADRALWNRRPQGFLGSRLAILQPRR